MTEFGSNISTARNGAQPEGSASQHCYFGKKHFRLLVIESVKILVEQINSSFLIRMMKIERVV